MTKLRDLIAELWRYIADLFKADKNIIETFSDTVLSDLIRGKSSFSDNEYKPYSNSDSSWANITPEVRAEMEEIKKKTIANGTFMKAPNGLDSKLEEKDWLLVRTKAFKKWFGDWERLAELENIVNSNKNSNFAQNEEYERKLQQEEISSNAQGLSSWSKELGESSKIYGTLKESARNLQRRDDRRNEETREILREELKKLAKEQGLWVDNLDAVLKDNFGAPINMGGEAIIYKGKDDTIVKSLSLDYYKGNPIEALERIIIHNHFFPETALTDIGFGQDVDGTFKIIVAQPYIKGAESATHAEIQQYITQELGFTTKDGNVYYGHGVKLNDLNPKNVLKKVDANGNTHYFVIDLEARDNTFNLESLQQEYKSLKGSVSRVRDKNGEPLAVYNGNSEKYKIYDGGFFTSNKEFATNWASDGENTTTAAFLNIKNPLIVDAKGEHWRSIPFEGKDVWADDIVELGEIRGYDGAIITQVDEDHDVLIDDYIPYSSNQVKSADTNIGTYSKENDDIRFSIRKDQESSKPLRLHVRRKRAAELQSSITVTTDKAIKVNKKIAYQECWTICAWIYQYD